VPVWSPARPVTRTQAHVERRMRGTTESAHTADDLVSQSIAAWQLFYSIPNLFNPRLSVRLRSEGNI
jgi:hypothetical protein